MTWFSSQKGKYLYFSGSAVKTYPLTFVRFPIIKTLVTSVREIRRKDSERVSNTNTHLLFFILRANLLSLSFFSFLILKFFISQVFMWVLPFFCLIGFFLLRFFSHIFFFLFLSFSVKFFIWPHLWRPWSPSSTTCSISLSSSLGAEHLLGCAGCTGTCRSLF